MTTHQRVFVVVIDVHINKLRKKLRKLDFTRAISSVRGLGYRFDAPA